LLKAKITFVAEYRDGSFDRFGIDPFTLLSGKRVALVIAREQQEEGTLKPGAIVSVHRDRRL
jgi:hypothetical protein